MVKLKGELLWVQHKDNDNVDDDDYNDNHGDDYVVDDDALSLSCRFYARYFEVWHNKYGC